MAAVGYTTTDKLRAVLGLTDKELGDKMILDLDVETQVFMVLDRAYPDHETLKQKIDDGTATAAEKSVWRILSLFFQYEAACTLLPQFQMIVVQKISDGDAEMSRFGPDNLEQFREELRARRDEYLSLLDPEGTEASATSWQFGVVKPTYDPVTNEGAQ